MKKCPYCAEDIQDDAIRCRYCGSDLERASSALAIDTRRGGSPITGGALLTLLGGILVMVGSFLPWLTASAPLVGTISKNGMEGGDGIATLVLGVIIAVVGAARLLNAQAPTFLQRSPIVLGVVVAVIAFLNLNDVNDRISAVKGISSLVSASVGAGIYALFVGAASSIFGGLSIRTSEKATQETQDSRGTPSGP